MDDYGTATYKARRSFKRIIPLFIFFCFFIPLGVVVFGVLPQIFFLIMVLSPGSSYKLGVNDYQESAIQSERNLDIKSWYKSNKMYGNFIKFCTVPIVQTRTSRGHCRNIVKFGTRTSGDFVLLHLSDGEGLLISPQETDAFIARLRNTTTLSTDIDVRSHISKLDEIKSDANLEKRKAWAVYRIAAFAITTVVEARAEGLRQMVTEAIVGSVD